MKSQTRKSGLIERQIVKRGTLNSNSTLMQFRGSLRVSEDEMRSFETRINDLLLSHWIIKLSLNVQNSRREMLIEFGRSFTSPRFTSPTRDNATEFFSPGKFLFLFFSSRHGQAPSSCYQATDYGTCCTFLIFRGSPNLWHCCFHRFD